MKSCEQESKYHTHKYKLYLEGKWGRKRCSVSEHHEEMEGIHVLQRKIISSRCAAETEKGVAESGHTAKQFIHLRGDRPGYTGGNMAVTFQRRDRYQNHFKVRSHVT